MKSFSLRSSKKFKIKFLEVRVGEDVAALTPHSPERARFGHSVLRQTGSLTLRYSNLFTTIGDSSGEKLPFDCSAPAWLFAPVSLTRSRVSKHPPCFSKAILFRRCLAFLDRVRPSGVPRRHQYYQGTKTSCAECGVTYGFASLPQPSSPRSLPCGGDLRKGLAPFKPGTIG